MSLSSAARPLAATKARRYAARALLVTNMQKGAKNTAPARVPGKSLLKKQEVTTWHCRGEDLPRDRRRGAGRPNGGSAALPWLSSLVRHQCLPNPTRKVAGQRPIIGQTDSIIPPGKQIPQTACLRSPFLLANLSTHGRGDRLERCFCSHHLSGVLITLGPPWFSRLVT